MFHPGVLVKTLSGHSFTSASGQHVEPIVEDTISITQPHPRDPTMDSLSSCVLRSRLLTQAEWTLHFSLRFTTVATLSVLTDVLYFFDERESGEPTSEVQIKNGISMGRIRVQVT